MRISEVIKNLEAILATEGDIRVTVFDEYTADEGWGYKNEDLWVDAEPFVAVIRDENGKELERVVQM